jgi:diguanylate cyclase (GGDEF)-like protein/PAS domain S-box-containing protein
MTPLDNPDTYRHVLEELPTGVYLVGRDGRILFWNYGAERITGFLRQDVVGHACQEDFLGCTPDENGKSGSAAAETLEAVLRDGKASEWQGAFRHKAGHLVPVKLRAIPMRDGRGAIIGTAGCFDEVVNVADWDRRHSKLAEYGCLDTASGVLTHKMVESRLRECLATYTESLVPFCVLCIAFDHLLELKARYGDAALAAVLRMAGQALETSLRPTDYVGRWQDNEFLAIVLECNRAEIPSVGERLRKTIERTKVKWWGEGLPVTISIGATSVLANDTIRDFLWRAEGALRDAMAQGGNRIVVWQELQESNG